MTAWANQKIKSGENIGLVPTMGYFHEGHLALMRMAARKADKVVVSLFVNPIQFGPGEDLEQYPRDFDRDAALAANENVNVIFAPEVEEMYPDAPLTTVKVRSITENLCGRSRAGHFDGVATVVAKLFHIVKPDVAVFGEKDFQQLAVIRRMVKDLNWDTEIVGHPIVREPDGLAMSSRNTYLNGDERQKALCLYKAIQYARDRIRQKMYDARQLIAEINEQINAEQGVEVEYIKIVDQNTLLDQEKLDIHSRLAMAVRVGEIRLIDNAGLFEGV